MESTTEPLKKKKKKKKRRIITASNVTQSDLLRGIDSDVLAARMREGEYSGMDDDELKQVVARGKRKKSPDDIRADSIRNARKRANRRQEFEKKMRQQEKAALKKRAFDITSVEETDKDEFLTTLHGKSKSLRDFMLKELASTQFGVTSALDVVLQELNIILDGGVTSNAVAPFLRLNSEIALVALTSKLCDLYGLDKATKRKIVEAKIEFMKPHDKPATKSLAAESPRKASPSR